MKKPMGSIVGSDELERLLSEKEDLLRTGVYSTDDPLI